MAATINQSRWMIYTAVHGIYTYVCAGYLQVVKTKIAQRTQSDFKSIIYTECPMLLPVVKWFRYFKLTYTRHEYDGDTTA